MHRPDDKVSVIPDIPSIRKIVRVKGSSVPPTISEKHSLQITEEASLESPASTSTQESVPAVQSPLASSAYMPASSNSLFKSGELSIYSCWSHEHSCMERFTLSLDKLEQYNQACEAVRYDLYRESCQFDR